MDSSLVPANQHRGLIASPDEVLETATLAAKALHRVVAQKHKPVIINGEQYLEFEDLQLLGQFYGYTVRTLEAEPVEINGVQGARARAELIDFRTGEVFGGADAYCMADEDRWAGRPWFQLASMAQTRAGAKAFRNRLAWVAVLAGYRPTPAEEMMSEEPQEKAHWCATHNAAFRKFSKNDRTWYSHKAPDGSWCNERAKEPEEGYSQANGDEPAPAKAAPAVISEEESAERGELLRQIKGDAAAMLISDEQLHKDAKKKAGVAEYWDGSTEYLRGLANRMALALKSKQADDARAAEGEYAEQA